MPAEPWETVHMLPCIRARSLACIGDSFLIADVLLELGVGARGVSRARAALVGVSSIPRHLQLLELLPLSSQMHDGPESAPFGLTEYWRD